MRISDWSSDVCSSDLHPPRLFMPPARHQEFRRFGNEGPEGHEDQAARQIGEPKRAPAEDGFEPDREQAGRGIAADRSEPADKDEAPRSAERRVGKACGSTCRSRWWQYH